MPDPTALRSDDFEILAVRELRKSGLELAIVRRPRRWVIADGDDERGEDYVLRMEGSVRAGTVERRVLIECRREREPVRPAAVRELRELVIERELESAILFSASGFAADALREAQSSGVATIAIADGRAAFARSGYGSPVAPAPSWVPEFMAEVVALDVAGLPRHHLIVSGQPGLVLDQMALIEPPTTAEEGDTP
jgi:hypothetical protein